MKFVTIPYSHFIIFASPTGHYCWMFIITGAEMCVNKLTRRALHNFRALFQYPLVDSRYR